MNKLVKFFRKKKRAVESKTASERADKCVPANEYVSAEQSAADEEITAWHKRLRQVGPFIK